VRGAASALAVAFALSGCGTKVWDLDPVLDASVGDEADAGIESSADVPLARGCTTDFDCAQQSKKCDTENGQCVECVDDSQCTSPSSPHCKPLHQDVCVQCVIDSHCGRGQVCQQTTCYFPCPDGGGCPASAPKCNLQRGVCATCLTNQDCAAGEACQPASGTCVEGTMLPGPDGDGATDSGDGTAEEGPLEASPDATNGGQ
jgi:Cys-rich repeat protein